MTAIIECFNGSRYGHKIFNVDLEFAVLHCCHYKGNHSTMKDDRIISKKLLSTYG